MSHNPYPYLGPDYPGYGHPGQGYPNQGHPGNNPPLIPPQQFQSFAEPRAFEPEFVAGFNSPATYNTCMIASLFLGLHNTYKDLTCGELFECVFKFIELKHIGDFMDFSQVLNKDTSASTGQGSLQLSDQVTAFLNFVSNKYKVKIIFWTCIEYLGNHTTCPDINFMKGIRVDEIGHHSYQNAISMILNGGHFYYMYGHAKTDAEIVRKGQSSYNGFVRNHQILADTYAKYVSEMVGVIRPDLEQKQNQELDQDAQLAQAIYDQDVADASAVSQNHRQGSHQVSSVPITQTSTHSSLPMYTPFPLSSTQSDTMVAAKLSKEINGGNAPQAFLPKPTVLSPSKSSPTKSSSSQSTASRVYPDHNLVVFIQDSQFVQDMLRDPSLLDRAQKLFYQMDMQKAFDKK